MSLNKVMLIGNLGRDPEVRYVMQDVPVATFTVATTEKGYRLANGTEVPDQTEWHNVVLWRGLAKIAEQYLHKGDKVYIEGKIKTRTYDDKNGVQKRITENGRRTATSCPPSSLTPFIDLPLCTCWH